MANDWNDRPYEVGKGKPPVNTRFGQPGRAPNRSGRRKGAVNADTVFDRAIYAKLKIDGPNGVETLTKFEAAMIQLSNRAAKGDLKAIELLARLKRERDSRQEPERSTQPLSEKSRAFLNRVIEESDTDGLDES